MYTHSYAQHRHTHKHSTKNWSLLNQPKYLKQRQYFQFVY